MEAWAPVGQQGHAAEGGENGARLPLEMEGVGETRRKRHCASAIYSSPDGCFCGNIG